MKIKDLADFLEARYGDPDQFMANVRRWMHEYKIPQSHLAREAGLDTSNLNRWVKGHVTPTLKNMLTVDEALERMLEARDAV